MNVMTNVITIIYFCVFLKRERGRNAAEVRRKRNKNQKK